MLETDIDSSKTEERVFGIGIYARNNISSVLKIDSFQVMDIAKNKPIHYEYYREHFDQRLNKNFNSSLIMGSRNFHLCFYISKADYPGMRTAFNSKTISVTIYSSRGSISTMPRPYYTSWLHEDDDSVKLLSKRDYRH